jgi:cytochrome b subunit of formate dehydrogenase
MDSTLPAKPLATAREQAKKYYTRFDLSQRIEHLVLLISFTILGATGLAQKFATAPAGEAILGFFGGIEQSRVIHRGAAVALMAVSIYHLIEILYRILVLRVSFSMLPVPEDFKHLYHDVLYHLGLRKHKAYYGRYSYAEKVEYLAVVWGTLIMAITGFMMWNPIATTRWLPGEFIPAAKAAHGGEALLAVLAIILWHFYHVHIRHFNKSMFTGKLTEEEMRHEHPAELAQIKSGQVDQKPTQEVLRRRLQFFLPIAFVLTVAFSFGLVKFVTFEQTAIDTVPPGETAPIFVPITPTPTATPLPSPTPGPGGEIQANTWKGAFQELFGERCGACHVQSNLGGLSLATYTDALKGGQSGPAIVPGDPDASLLVQIQSAGNHPGQLTIDELEKVIQWIEAGAPEE